MGLNCVITIPGDGVGKYGKPKKDRTGPLREFLVFNQFFFTRVKQHLVGCQVCDVDEALQVYKGRVLAQKSGVMAGDSTVQALLSLERAFKKLGRSIDSGLVTWIALRGTKIEVALERAQSCTLMEQFNWIASGHIKPYHMSKVLAKERFHALHRIHQTCPNPTAEELTRLMQIAEVMLT